MAISDYNYQVFNKAYGIQTEPPPRTSEMMMLEDIRHVQKLIHLRMDSLDQMYKKMADLYDVVMLALVKNIEVQYEKEIQQEQ